MRGSVWVAWYLRPDRGTVYLQQPEKWQPLDLDLFDVLRKLVNSHARSIKCSGLQSSSVLLANIRDSCSD